MACIKRFVCLANSRKVDGHCVAGKEILANGTVGGWIRPVSAKASQALSARERSYRGWQEPKLGEIVELGLLRYCPEENQTENYLVDGTQQWRRVGCQSWTILTRALDAFAGALWIDGHSSRNGLNDVIPYAKRKDCRSSLLLLEPERFAILIRKEGEYGTRRIRADFSCGGVEYILSITDPLIEKAYERREEGNYELAGARICVSVGHPYPEPNGPCYKFVAGVMLPKP